MRVGRTWGLLQIVEPGMITPPYCRYLVGQPWGGPQRALPAPSQQDAGPPGPGLRKGPASNPGGLGGPFSREGSGAEAPPALWDSSRAGREQLAAWQSVTSNRKLIHCIARPLSTSCPLIPTRRRCQRCYHSRYHLCPPLGLGQTAGTPRPAAPSRPHRNAGHAAQLSRMPPLGTSCRAEPA